MPMLTATTVQPHDSPNLLNPQRKGASSHLSRPAQATQSQHTVTAHASNPTSMLPARPAPCKRIATHIIAAALTWSCGERMGCGWGQTGSHAACQTWCGCEEGCVVIHGAFCSGADEWLLCYL